MLLGAPENYRYGRRVRMGNCDGYISILLLRKEITSGIYIQIRTNAPAAIYRMQIKKTYWKAGTAILIGLYVDG